MEDKDYLIKESTLTSISQAIKNIYSYSKLDKIDPLDMPEQIQNQVEYVRRQCLGESINSMGVEIVSMSEREISDYVDGYEFQYNDNTKKYEIVRTSQDVGFYMPYTGLYVPYTEFIASRYISYNVLTPGWTIHNNKIVPDD